MITQYTNFRREQLHSYGGCRCSCTRCTTAQGIATSMDYAHDAQSSVRQAGCNMKVMGGVVQMCTYMYCIHLQEGAVGGTIQQ